MAKKQVSKAKTVNPGTFNPIIPSTQFPQFPVFPPQFLPQPAPQSAFQPSGPSFQPPQHISSNQPNQQYFQQGVQQVQGPQLSQAIPQQQPMTFIGLQKPTGQSNTVLSAQAASADEHIRFLHSLTGVDKAFCIECVVKCLSSVEIQLRKATTQADQGSEMNMISKPLVDHLQLVPQLVSSIGFQGLTMHTADHRDTPLKEWTEAWIGVAGI